MPAKGKGKAKAKGVRRQSADAKAKAAPALAGPAAEQEPVGEATPSNAPEWAKQAHLKMQSAFAVLNEKWEGVDALQPLSLAQGGVQAPFSAAECVQAMANCGQTYKCAGNLFWHNVLANISHMTPINGGQVKEIMKFYFKEGSVTAVFPFEVVVAVTEQEAASADKLTACLGTLDRLSPEEPIHALLLAAEVAVNKGHADIPLFLHLIRTIPFRFEIHPHGEARFWRAANIREEQVENGLVVERSVRQRIFEIAGFKAKTEKTQAASCQPTGSPYSTRRT